ncbi:MAG TPA: succinate dehydrogenase, cytochrome b556 subunit [Burkholderiaceae bacterium]|nr:succinate dehydrogenase, cytochrome b556 subunit [Burkholderiaceae bacterium]HMZ01936.1 succinate dehydrogenase, cytochrome b556 subunit [Burkholderiaceae bacterium]HNB45609.1 succinate dehydrogenase, cytochrome b556 subunit [Burkholderiaceae bacterium]HNG81864.1 succinate dehydrogenase, cytochrome b556 subunit [Burkholderiaceae bacterium]
MADTLKQRPGPMRLIDATQYRLPLAAKLSILHRASGVLMFVLLPFVIWMFDTSVSSEVSFETFTAVLSSPLAKLVALGLIWAYLHHFCAGVRHLWMDATHSVTKEQGHSSAVVSFAISLLLTVALAAKLFGLF